MAQGQRVGGAFTIRIDNEVVQAGGEFSYSIQNSKREKVIGASQVLGYSEMPMAPFFEGVIQDFAETDLEKILHAREVDATLELNNGKTIAFTSCEQVGEGETNTASGQAQIRFEAISAVEVA